MTIHPTAFIHPAAFVCGDVTLGARASVWPTAVIRADSAPVTIGESSNVQDGVIIHVDPGLPCTIGARVAIGHRAIVHGAVVEDDCLIAMGAIDALRYELGLDVPGNVSVVGFDDVSMASWPSHALTTYRHPMREMASATVDLIKRMERELATSARLVKVVEDYLGDEMNWWMFRCEALEVLKELLPQNEHQC